MKQTVLIGLGGTGSRVVNNVAKILRSKSIGINDGTVTCAVLDTNKSDNTLIENSGTAIPVIGTSDKRKIKQYLKALAGKEPYTWCPYSTSFGEETMIDGASEMRVKSRIAFLDTMNSSTIHQLQSVMESIFHNQSATPDKIRVMVVSSLAGGTGSGMFIQTALWLRKFFDSRNCLSTIRGILLLPDIFVNTCENIRDNPRKKLYHYANAYAAIRELNAINKVVKGNVKLERPIIIDDLFDSRRPPEKPVFDNAFFIDAVDASGATFETLSDYEEMVAQITYMQLYAPMHSEMISVEDNLYRSFEKSSEPIFGSCGTARAEYPGSDVLEYCALRATQDSISTSWGKIDAEIDALEKEEERDRRNGAVISNPVVRRDKFIELFDEKSNKNSDEIGRGDGLFVRIKNDIFEETREKAGDEIIVTSECKAEKLMDLLDKEIDAYVTKNGGCKDIEQVGSKLPDPKAPKSFHDNLEKDLKGVRNTELKAINKVLDNFDEKKKEYVDAIVRSFVPLDMGAVNRNDEKTLFGLFQKKNADGKDFIVHPIAAKYLLYKLSAVIEQRQSKIVNPQSSRDNALKGSKTVSFDNNKTSFKKETLENYWKQVGAHVSKAELAHFIKCYKLYNTANVVLCKQYENDVLKQGVYKALSEKVNELINVFETLFKGFSEVNETLVDKINENVKKNDNANDLSKVMYVFAKRAHKESIYDSLGFDVSESNGDLNKNIVEAVYGKYCATLRPDAEDNKEYADRSVVSSFYNLAKDSFSKLIKEECREKIYIDIIKAIKAESDFNNAEDAKKENENDNYDHDSRKEDISDETTEADRTAFRHKKAILECRNKLAQKAVPFLIAEPDESLAVAADVDGLTIDENSEVWMTTESGEKLLMPLQTTLTFWGFHPKLVELCPDIEDTLGANKTTSADDAYGLNTIYCYSSIYGVKAEAISKLNEQTKENYYKYYSAVINDMIKNGTEIDTPHIDKTWHEFLPYVSSTRQGISSQKFFKAFWCAIAYGRISLDSHGKFQISKSNKDSYGNVTYTNELLLNNGKEIRFTDIAALVNTLKEYPDFELIVAKELEERFEKDVDKMTTYIGTGIVSGLVTDGELNPVTMVVRYEDSKDFNLSIKNDLIGGLGEVLREVASHYDMNRGDKQINEAKVKLCHRIYEKSNMTKKNEVFDAWLEDFKALKLAVKAAANEAPVAEEVVDII